MNRFGSSTVVQQTVYVAILLFVIIALPFGLYVVNFGTGFSTSKAEWGAFGDFMNLFVGLSNITITIYIGWILYTLQKNDIRDKDRADQLKIKNEKILSFQKLSSCAIMFAENNITSVTDYTDKLSPNSPYLPKRSGFSDTELKIITENIDRESLFLAYIETVEKDNMYDIFRTFDVMYGNYKHQTETFREFYEVDHANVKNTTDSIRQLRNDLSSSLLEILENFGENSNEYSELIKVIQGFDDTVEVNNSNFYLIRDLIKETILPFVYENNKFLQNPYLKIHDSCRKVLLNISDIDKDREWYKGILINIKNDLEINRDQAIKATKDLKDYIEKRKAEH